VYFLEILLLALLAFFLFYAVVPTVVIRVFSLRIYKKGNKRNTIALTFDDGPDSIYTPRLLDLLKKYQVKATFFVVGEKAKQHPDIIKRMHQEGHEIGLHNYRHISNWFVLPFFLSRGLRKSADIIEQIIQERPIYYRPPWGHFNLCTLPLQKQYKTVMWTHIPGDWKENVGALELFHRLKTCQQDGSIIVLHDSGETFGADVNAPENMLAALELFLKEGYTQKIRWVTLSEMLNAQNKKQIS
jgi:peptidoglycan-N-acetylglucosamine deacetylase